MLNIEVSKLMNDQIQKELFSAYLYLDIANYYADEGLDGFANWFYIQVREELDHAELFRTYLLNNDEKIKLYGINAPNTSFADFNAPLVMTLSHEQSITASIDNLYEVAVGLKDYRTMEFLNWFVKEQGEEEKNSNDMLKKFELFGNDAKGLYQLDQELGGRTYSPPDLQLD